MRECKRYIRHQAGFTLIEMLLVIVVIAVSAALLAPGFIGAAVPSLSDEARRLRQAFILASEEAVLSGRPIRLVAEAHQYAFESSDADHHWHEMTGQPYAGHRMPAEIFIVGLSSPHTGIIGDGKGNDAGAGKWQLVLSPLGTAAPADVVMGHRDGRRVLISIQPGGRVSLRSEPS